VTPEFEVEKLRLCLGVGQPIRGQTFVHSVGR
jgi:hypothetical protein